MDAKLEAIKLAVRAKRSQEVWKDTVGEQFDVPRDGKDNVAVFLYRPQNGKAPYPVIFNIHGGGWVGCDASELDSFCVDMAEKCGAFIVNINYTKVDVNPFPYPQEEIRDTVMYFRDNAAAYGLDTSRFAMMGFSAGGHLAAASTLMLHDMGIDLSAQVLGYAFLDFTAKTGLLDEGAWNVLQAVFFPEGVSTDDPYISPVKATDQQLKGIAPAIFVCCGPDPLTEHDKVYRTRLEENGVHTSFRLYDEALHGFIEVNHKEYPAQEAKNPQQEAFAKDAEDFIAAELNGIWSRKNV